MHALPRVAIAVGDPAGIGPEIALKAAIDPRVQALARVVLVGDAGALALHAKHSGIVVPVDAFASAAELAWHAGHVALLAREHFQKSPLELGRIRPQHGRAVIDAAECAIRAAIDGHVDAVVGAPHTELAVQQAGIAFDGYPGLVARCTGTPVDDVFLMLCFDREGVETRIVHTTLHVGLKQAIELITPDRLDRVMRATDTALKQIGLSSPRIAVSGLNPHAGEAGLFGDEEIDLIAPAIGRASAQGIHAEGPFGADTMFAKPGYDAFIVMVHDQGHILAKSMAPNRAAGVAIGSPILFSSVGHGSALDVAGQNKASPEALIGAIRRLANRSPRHTHPKDAK